ncbi:female-specific histamine-binding protein 2-like [Amblyomma americanum]
MHSVLRFTLAAAVCLHAVAFMIPFWADENKFGQYQDALKVLNQTTIAPYVLLKATHYRDSPLWGNNFTCVSVRAEVNHNKSYLFHFEFRNGTRGIPQNSTLLVNAAKDYFYNKWNAINFTLPGGRMLVETVIFTNGRNCYLLSVPHLKTRKACELWVSSSRVHNVPSCCAFMFDVLCPRPGPFIIYNATVCNKTTPLATKQMNGLLTGRRSK